MMNLVMTSVIMGLSFSASSSTFTVNFKYFPNFNNFHTP